MGRLIPRAILSATSNPARTATSAPASVVHMVDRTRPRSSGVWLNRVIEPTGRPSCITGTLVWIEPVLSTDQSDNSPSSPSMVASVIRRAPAPVSASRP